MLSKLDHIKEVELYILAYPNITKEEIKFCLENYGEDFQWNKKMSCKDEIRNINLIYEKNILLVKDCKKFNMKLYDVSIHEKREACLESIYNQIINKN